MDRSCRHQDRLHRARQSLGERYIESFNAHLRDELLNGEILYSVREARVVIESWRTPPLDSSHHRRRCSYPPSLLGRLRYAEGLRRLGW